MDDEVLLIRDENPRFYYNIKKNQTAADLANKIRNELGLKENNVILIFIDNLGRHDFKRKLPNVYKFLE